MSKTHIQLTRLVKGCSVAYGGEQFILQYQPYPHVTSYTAFGSTTSAVYDEVSAHIRLLAIEGHIDSLEKEEWLSQLLEHQCFEYVNNSGRFSL